MLYVVFFFKPILGYHQFEIGLFPRYSYTVFNRLHNNCVFIH